MKKNKFNIIVLALFAAVLVFSLFKTDSPMNLWNAVKSAKPFFLGAAALCMLGYWLFESLSLYSVANQMKSRLSFRESLTTSMVGQLFNCITPFASGGQPVQAYRLKQYGIPVGKASCILLAKFIVYQVVLTIYSLILILLKFRYFMGEIKGFHYLILAGFAVNLVVVLALISVGFFPKASSRIAGKLVSGLHRIHIVRNKEKMMERISVEMDAFYVNFKQLKHNLRILIVPSLMTMLQLTLFFTVPFFICISLGISASYFVSIISAAAFVLMISSFIPLPGGSGGAEGGFYLLFSLFSPTTSIVAVTLLLWRVFTFYMPIIVGMVFSRLKVNRLGHKVKRKFSEI